ncbi:hypothetical protein [Corynebacterium matruchotii]|uniref:hypothetical protein n=1 Tax=Corynebacterium matruchotii TaxID=43768 RepID=UPI0028EF0FDC|nr:hypothetical protein [Corynebacterium matruchotii]
MTTQNPNPNDPSDPQGGNGELHNYDTGAAFAMTPEPGDGLIRDKKNYLEITALVFGVLAIISMIFDPRSGIILTLVCIIAAIIALIQRKKYAPENRRTWFSIVGLACAVTSLAILVFYLVNIYYFLLEKHPECQQGTSSEKAKCIQKVVKRP